MVQAIIAIPQFFQAYVMLSNGSEYNNTGWFVAISVTSIILLAALSLFIWKLSNNIATKISSESTSSSSNIKDEFILSALGLYLIVFGLLRVSLTSTTTYYLIKTTSDSNIDFNIVQNIIYLVTYFVVSILGLSLVIKASGWVRLLNKLRVAGT